jgi:hypothetical protein
MFDYFRTWPVAIFSKLAWNQRIALLPNDTVDGIVRSKRVLTVVGETLCLLGFNVWSVA